MDSQKSSLSLFWLTFRSAVKGNFIFPLLNLIILILAIPVSTWFSINNFTDPNFMGSQGTGYAEPPLADITEFYKFYFHSNAMYLHLSILIFSIILGVKIFYFVTNMKTANVYFSLGITRKNLFTANYTAGLLMLFISISIPFSAGFIINVLKFGYSSELLVSIIYNIAGYTALAAVAFSVATAVICCVGTIIEGISFSAIILAAPTMLFYCIELLMKKLTLGSPFSIYSYYNNNQLSFKMNPLLPILSKYNPVLFLYNDVEKSSYFPLGRSGELFPWVKPEYSIIVAWLIIAVVIFVLGIYLFKKRKAEICGFIGVNKWLNFAITFLMGFLPFCLAVSYIHSLILGIAAGLVAYTILYIIIDMALIRNIKSFKKGFIKLPLHIIIASLILVVFSTGLLGYSSRVPNIDKIESAEINPVAYMGMIDPIQSRSLDYDVVDIGKPVSGFKSEKDLKTITDIHRLIVKTGKLKNTRTDYTVPQDRQITNTTINIIYHLKNGRTVRRYYRIVTMEIMNAMLKIDKTDRYKQLLLQNLTEPVSKNDSPDTIERKDIFQSKTSVVSICPSHLDLGYQIKISPVQKTGLLKALSKDLTVQTIKQRYYPDHPALGVIQFYRSYDEEEFKNVPVGGTVLTTPRNLAQQGCSSIVITEDMINTLNFLEVNGYKKYLENNKKYEYISAQVIIPKAFTDLCFWGNEFSLQFRGKCNWDNDIDFDYGSFKDAYKVTDKAIVREMEANAHISYFNSAGGYYALFNQNNNGGKTAMFIPADKMPQSVIDGVAGLAK